MKRSITCSENSEMLDKPPNKIRLFRIKIVVSRNLFKLQAEKHIFLQHTYACIHVIIWHHCSHRQYTTLWVIITHGSLFRPFINSREFLASRCPARVKLNEQRTSYQNLRNVRYLFCISVPKFMVNASFYPLFPHDNERVDISCLFYEPL